MIYGRKPNKIIVKKNKQVRLLFQIYNSVAAFAFQKAIFFQFFNLRHWQFHHTAAATVVAHWHNNRENSVGALAFIFFQKGLVKPAFKRGKF